MNSESLIVKYRPDTFSGFVGQKSISDSFRKALDDRTAQSFLFAGPSGVGKTTLARIGVKYLDCTRANLIERDAAMFNSVDDMRELVDGLANRPIGKDAVKCIIMDECHALSRQAWQPALKAVEEPARWLYWFFCTTDVAKVPKTIQTRCTYFTLRPLSAVDLYDFIEDVVEKEGFDTPRTIIELISKCSDGSPRKALSNLSACYSARDRQEAARLIANHEVEASDDSLGFQLARALANTPSWAKLQPLLENLRDSDESPETIRHIVRQYFTTVMIGTKDERIACDVLKILDNFLDPFSPTDGWTPLAVAVGRSIF